MAIKNKVFKIATAVGKSNIGQDVKAVANATKNLGKKVYNNKYLTDISESEKLNSLMYSIFPKKVKTKYVVGAGTLIGGIAAANAIGDAQDRASYGEIEGGGLSHMTSEVSSPLISDMQKGDYDSANVMHNSSYRDTGASGDIVLALHNMR